MTLRYRFLALGFCLAVLSSSVSASPAGANVIRVTTFKDELNPVSRSGTGVSLREAIRDAAATPDVDEVIELRKGTYRLTITGAGEDGNATGDLDIPGTQAGGSFTIYAGGRPNETIIDASALGERAFHTTDADGGSELSIVGVTIRGSTSGSANGQAILLDGGGLFMERSVIADTASNSGALCCLKGAYFSIRETTFTGNSSQSPGGAIAMSEMSSGQIAQTTFEGNTALNSAPGGGIWLGDQSSVSLENCTLSGNSAEEGAAIYFEDSSLVRLTHCTVAKNTGANGGAIHNRVGVPGQMVLTNCIVANNSTPKQLDGPPGPNSLPIGTYVGENLLSGNAFLGDLDYYGDLTKTMPPTRSSDLVIGKADDEFALGVDQGNRVRGLGAELGAVEIEPLHWSREILRTFGVVLEVTNADDTGPGSLRAAIEEVNAAPFLDGYVLVFSRKLSGETITLTSGPLQITSPGLVMILGASLKRGSNKDLERLPKPVVISGNSEHRAFTLGTGSQVWMQHLEIVDAEAPDPESGGGIFTDGFLGLHEVRISYCKAGYGNGALNSGGDGGGVFVAANGLLETMFCTIEHNQSGPGAPDLTFSQGGNGGDGGGVFVAGGMARISHTTIADNLCGDGFDSTGIGLSAGRGGNGGGLGVTSSGKLYLSNSTITDNKAGLGAFSSGGIFDGDGGDGGGIFAQSGTTLDIRHCTIAGNRTGLPGSGSNGQEGDGGGIAESGNCDLTIANSIISGNDAQTTEIDANIDQDLGVNLVINDAQLAPLANYGGLVSTMPPLPGSPAIDQGDFAYQKPTDQRGVARSYGLQPEIGAVEYDEERLNAFFQRSEQPNGSANTPTFSGEPFDRASSPASYSGLLRTSADDLMGNFSIRLARNRSLSGTFTIRGQRYAFRQTIGENGSISAFVESGGITFELNLSLVRTTGGAGELRMVGTLRDVNNSQDYAFDLDRPTIFGGSRGPAPMAGRYTALVKTDAVDTVYEDAKGDGYFLVNVSPSGRVNAMGQMPDGVRTSIGGYVTADNEWRAFQSFSGSPAQGRGIFGGVIAFRDVAGVSDFDGELTWRKFFGGFFSGNELVLPLIGSRFDRPFPGHPLLYELDPAAEFNALWTIGHGGVSHPGVQGLRWNGQNRIVSIETNEIGLRVNAAPANGLVRGVFFDESMGARVPMKFSGVVFQKQGLVSGLFPGYDGATGFFSIKPIGESSITVRDENGVEILAGGTIDMGNVGVDPGTLSERRFEIENTGLAHLYLSKAPELLNPDVFAITSGGPVLLAPGEKTYFTIRFHPPSQGNEFTILGIYSNAANVVDGVFAALIEGDGIAGGSNGPSVSQSNWLGASPSGFPFHYGRVPFSSPIDPGMHGGNFVGYAYSPDTGGEIAGQVTVRMNKRTGSYSAVAVIDGVSHRFKGSLTNVAGDSGTTNRGANFSISLGKTDFISLGIVIDGSVDGKFVLLVQDLASVMPGLNVLNAGRYSILLPPSEARGAGQPLGTGYGTMVLAASGRISGMFRLGDGTAVSHGGIMSNDFEWLFYRALYGGAKSGGYLGGRILFGDRAAVSDFDGRLQWVKPERRNDRLYPRGFRLEQLILGAKYEPPIPGDIALHGVNGINQYVIVDFIDSDIDPLPGPLLPVWNFNNRITYTPVGSERLSLRVNVRNGLLSGLYVDPSHRQRIPVNAVIFNKQMLASGLFTGPSETGSVIFTGAP
ncbi:MAG: right-handed parallel beta-helix repeat-containing protein [Verrucomicrobiae bacterium]|nr:right-handed parallel beta-helix repeat-containing protein [Verrucomicrobiae bacterium]